MTDHETPSYDPSTIQSYDYVTTDSDGDKGCRNWAIGCSIAMLVVLILMVIAGFFVARNAIPFAANAIAEGVEEVVEQAHLTPEQKREITTRVEGLKEDFVAGELTLEDLGNILERIIECRAVIAGGAEFVIRTQLIEQLDLSEEQQAQINRLMQRLARGIVEEYLDPEDFEPIKDIVLVEKGENNYELKEDLTKEEIEEFLVALENMVNEAGVPDEPYEIDIASELDRIIEEVRGKN